MCPIGTVIYVGHGLNPEAEVPTRRLIRWFNGVGYGKNHWTWVDTRDGRSLDGNVADEIINTELRLRRVEHLRSSDRQKLKSIYNERVRPYVEDMKAK